eukprot:GFUD01032707.1.p1 GENE.GFUD01032707.1~~GFUD01032707.1.p1  ORF type:complete len:653 (-),score=136.83 GFUD01032707.1:29-1936(-)
MSAHSTADTIHCLLCGGAFLYPGPRYSAHLLNEHGVVYDIDFLIQVSLHKKTSASLPALSKPGRSSNKFVTENSSQTTEGSSGEALCNSCRETEEGQTIEWRDESWPGLSQDDVNDEELHQEEKERHEVNQDQSEHMVIKPDIDATFGSSYNLKNSTKISEPLASDMQCYFNCGEVFKKSYDLELHLKLRHKEEDPIELARAAESAQFEIALTRRSGTVYQCAMCDKTVQGWSTFWEHIRKHKVSLHEYRAKYGKCEIISASFQCRVCDKIIKHETNIVHKHLQKVHGISWTQYLARVRGELRGIKQEPLPEVMLEQCTLCDQRVKYIKVHLKSKHGIITKVPCQICGESIKYLKEHLKRRHGITKDEYDQLLSEDVGEESPKQDLNHNFPTPKLAQPKVSAPELSGSVPNSITGETSRDSSRKRLPKPSKEEMRDKTVKDCSVCDLQFVNRRLFIEHCQIIHDVRFKTKAYGFLVPSQPQDTQSSNQHIALNSTFSQNPDNEGLRKVSKIVWPRQSFHQEGSLVCEACGGKFTSWRFLDQHMKLNCQRVACESCGKTFSSLVHLKKHRRLSCLGNQKLSPEHIAMEIVELVVSKVFSASKGPADVEFKCPFEICGQQFGRSVHLKRHLTNYHDE